MSQAAWERGKAAYYKGGLLLDPPSVAVAIPFAHVDPSAGDADVPIQAYLRSPKGNRPADGWPVLLFICGLDAYRTDITPRNQRYVGCAALIMGLALRQLERDRQTVRAHERVELRGQAAARATHATGSIIFLRTFAAWCTRTCEASIIWMSPS